MSLIFEMQKGKPTYWCHSATELFLTFILFLYCVCVLQDCWTMRTYVGWCRAPTWWKFALRGGRRAETCGCWRTDSLCGASPPKAPGRPKLSRRVSKAWLCRAVVGRVFVWSGVLLIEGGFKVEEDQEGKGVSHEEEKGEGKVSVLMNKNGSSTVKGFHHGREET